MAVQQDDPVYVRIETPLEVRKALLQSIKQLLQMLQANERLQEKKKQKSALAEEYRSKVKEITILLVAIKAQMPKVKVSNLPKKAARPQVLEPEMVAASADPEIVEVNISEADRLENELKEIEAKLNSL